MNGALAVTGASLLAYAACSGFFHAAPGRSAWSLTRDSARAGRVVRGLAWALLALAIAPLVPVVGWERAIPIWIAVLMGAGILSLLLAIFLPRPHLYSGAAALAAAAICVPLAYLN
ncbi:MAG: hypothetical protein AAGA23_05020 [Pseudomonadota bacterium]